MPAVGAQSSDVSIPAISFPLQLEKKKKMPFELYISGPFSLTLSLFPLLFSFTAVISLTVHSFIPSVFCFSLSFITYVSSIL
jgi:hypothetical protein